MTTEISDEKFNQLTSMLETGLLAIKQGQQQLKAQAASHKRQLMAQQAATRSIQADLEAAKRGKLRAGIVSFLVGVGSSIAATELANIDVSALAQSLWESGYELFERTQHSTLTAVGVFFGVIVFSLLVVYLVLRPKTLRHELKQIEVEEAPSLDNIRFSMSRTPPGVLYQQARPISLEEGAEKLTDALSLLQAEEEEEK